MAYVTPQQQPAYWYQMTRTPEAEDWDALLRASLAGDSAAYARFLRAVSPVLRGIVLARGRAALGEAGCEDVLQEVLLAIHLKRQTWRPDEPLRPWLYAIARHKVVDAFRRRGTRITVPVEDFAEVLAAPPAPDPTLRSDMDRMIGLLDGRSADVLRDIGLNGATITETGTKLGMTEVAVRVALHRGIKRLAALRERMLE